MAKPELGIKRICLSCGAKFYDLQKDPIVCPACSTTHDPESAAKLKRGRGSPASEEARKAKAAAAAKAKKAAEAPSDDVEIDDDSDDDSDDETVLEDTSDLGDEDDVPGVVKPSSDDS